MNNNSTKSMDINNVESKKTPFYKNLHIHYIETLAAKLDDPSSYEGAVTEHLRMSGIYWSLTALSLLLGDFEEDEKRANSLQKNDTDTQSTNEGRMDRLMGITTPLPTKKLPNTVQNGEEEKGTTAGAGTESLHSDAPEVEKRQTIIDFIFECYDPQSGGFGGNVGCDGHILYTLSALQILALVGHPFRDTATDTSMAKEKGMKYVVDCDAIERFVVSLQQADGSFAGDSWGEVDTRFSYCALSTLSLLGRLHTEAVGIDVPKAAQYVASCQNFDGGFGSMPGAESHAGQIFCCIGALSIAKSLHVVNNPDLLCWWLAERQCDSGGLNGRPEKQADVCYSWWILSSLCILGKVAWINGDKLAGFILKCQDEDDGGIADRPSDMPDVFHTFFGICGLSLLGYLHDEDKLCRLDVNPPPSANNDEEVKEAVLSASFRKIDPVYALPSVVVEKLGLGAQIMAPKHSQQSEHSNTTVDERIKMYDIYDPELSCIGEK